MAQQTINLGTDTTGTDGDTNRTAWGKAIANFTDLYSQVASAANTGNGASTAATKAQAAADKAQTAANAAQTSANSASAAAKTAQTSANSAAATANSAVATANAALPIAGGKITGSLAIPSGKFTVGEGNTLVEFNDGSIVINSSDYNDSNDKTAYGCSYDSRIPLVSTNLLVRVQSVNVKDEATYCRIYVRNNDLDSADFRFSHTGTATATNWQSTSDERIKKDVIKLRDALGDRDVLEALSTLTGYASYKKVSNTNAEKPSFVTDCGLMAGELQKVMPAAVQSMGSGIDVNGQTIENILAVNYNGLSALWVEAIKRLTERVNELEGRLTQLEPGS